MKYDDLIKLVREVILEARGTQDKRLRSFTNKITRSIMALYSNKSPELSYTAISKDYVVADLNTDTDEIYEINAGAFPITFDPETIDYEVYEEGVDPFITVVLEIERDAPDFNVSASDKNIAGTSDLGIHIAIETPKNFSNNQLGMLRNEVANSVRHELEHVSQGERSGNPATVFGRGEKYYNFLSSPEDVDSSYAKYFLKPEEIPSHVRGYSQNAKNFEDLKMELESLLSNYQNKDLISEKEKNIVLDTWLDWTKNNINRKGY